MTEESEPTLPMFIRYCHHCGGRMKVVRHEVHNGNYQAQLKCSNCGRETAVGWSTFSAGGSSTATGYSRSPGVRLDEDGKQEVIFDSELTPEQLSQLDSIAIPEVERNMQSVDESVQLVLEFRAEARERGIDFLLEEVGWPVFLPVDVYPRLHVRNFDYGGHPDEHGESRYVLGTLKFTFVGPIEGEPDESLFVGSRVGIRPVWLVIPVAAEYMTAVLKFLPSMSEFMPFGTVIRPVNLEILEALSPERFQTTLKSGDHVTWEIRRLDSPSHLAYASGKIRGTMVDVGAAGMAAKDITSFLSQFSLIAPGSVEAAELVNSYGG